MKETTKRKKWPVTVTLFCMIISIPLLGQVVINAGDDSSEQRILAHAPDVPDNMNELKNYPGKIDMYLNDRFGFREQFIKLNNSIHYYLFDDILSPQITVGENGYIYFNSHSKAYPNSIFRRVCDVDKINSNRILHSINTMRRFSDMLAKRGIKFVYILAPTKSRIYPEYLPDYIRRWCDRDMRTRIDRMVDDLRMQHGVKVYYPLEEFRSWKDLYPVYHKAQFHWYGETTYRVSRAVLSEMFGQEPVTDLSFEYGEKDSDIESYFLGLDIRVRYKNYSFKKNDIAICRGASCFSGIRRRYKRAREIKRIRNNEIQNGRLLIFSDSFGDSLAPYFSIAFSDVLQININRLNNARELYKLFNWLMDTFNPTHVAVVFHDYKSVDYTNKINAMITK
jgi:hypothetical protein